MHTELTKILFNNNSINRDTTLIYPQSVYARLEHKTTTQQIIPSSNFYCMTFFRIYIVCCMFLASITFFTLYKTMISYSSM